MAQPYCVPDGDVEVMLEVKKSRFIARAAYAASRPEAMAHLTQARLDYPDARHHCWAYLLGNPGCAASAAMNDAGEPSGTAGKPILNVIQHKGIGDLMVVVIRYFGGVKLGAGGLVRAYAGVTEAALSQLPLVQHLPRCEATLTLGFAQEQSLRHWAAGHEATVGRVDYGAGVTMGLSLPAAQREALEAFCRAHAIGCVID